MLVMRECWCQPFDYDDVRVILLDFDGILYSTPTFDNEYARYLAKIVSELSINQWDEATAFRELTDLEVIGGNPYLRADIREVCETDLGVLLEDFDTYRINHPFLPKLDKVTVFDTRILHKLSQEFHLVLVSNDSEETIFRKATSLNIDLSAFSCILTPTVWDVESYDKQCRFRKIINNFLLHGTEMYAVGTSFYADIAPILDACGAGLFVDVNNCGDTQMFLEDKFLGGKNGFV